MFAGPWNNFIRAMNLLRTDIPTCLDSLRRKILTNASQYQGFTSSDTLCWQEPLALFYGYQSSEALLCTF